MKHVLCFLDWISLKEHEAQTSADVHVLGDVWTVQDMFTHRTTLNPFPVSPPLRGVSLFQDAGSKSRSLPAGWLPGALVLIQTYFLTYCLNCTSLLITQI